MKEGGRVIGTWLHGGVFSTWKELEIFGILWVRIAHSLGSILAMHVNFISIGIETCWVGSTIWMTFWFVIRSSCQVSWIMLTFSSFGGTVLGIYLMQHLFIQFCSIASMVFLSCYVFDIKIQTTCKILVSWKDWHGKTLMALLWCIMLAWTIMLAFLALLFLSYFNWGGAPTP